MMRKAAITAFIVSITLAAAAYTILDNPPASNPTLLIWFPVTVGLLVAALLATVRYLFNSPSKAATLSVARQCLLVGVVVGVLLYVQGLRVVSTVDAFLIVLAAVLLELFFQAEKTDVRSIKPSHEA